MTTATKTLSAFLRTDLTLLGHDEFGGQVHGEVARVVVEAPDGSRWVHRHGFSLTVSAHNEDGFLVVAPDSEAVAKAEGLLARVDAAIAAGTWAGPVDNDHWGEAQPCYGSAAFSRDARRWENEMMDEDERAHARAQ
jgi:hypothetical protein